MREVFSDFMLLDDRPDGTVRVPLGVESMAQDLQGLCEGEAVLLVYPSELRAPATVESEMHQGERYWYGVISSRTAIEDIYSEPAAGSEPTERSGAAS